MENTKKVMVQFDFPEMTSEQYDQVWQDLRAAGHENPTGLEYHMSAQSGNGLKVIDVWENADKFNEFGQTLMPILNKIGITPTQPVILPLHNEYSANNVH